MPTLTITKGLPAAGKTTWAKKQNAKRVNKDDLRAMIDNGKWSKKNEEWILACRNFLAVFYLNRGYDVIIDDTNLAPKHEKDLRQLADFHKADFEIKDFTDVSLSTCLKRDSERANAVGAGVIKSMYKSFIKKPIVAEYKKPPHKEGFPYCIIVDIDGTLAHMNSRSPYDYTQVSTDVVDEHVRDVVHRYTIGSATDEIPDTYIVIVTGRDADCRPDTEAWLKANNIPYDELYMRDMLRVDDKGNKVDDRIIKRDIYEAFIKPRYNVRFVLDDRDRVVKMWREQGLKVLQCAEGDF